eukprot:TRINITY_DN2144_c0_g2_i1.p1 TRINITY_DN2144_c0_g2~~TRINITY_DN2144_c0_g2_i1.p1  ORF type:complete len:482 (+),score=147.34 TRINITY_DN2144_c0_g2_i1:214-1446(+)
MSGKEFAYILEDYMKKAGKEIHIGIIKDNPKQSKHLETAKIRILDLEVDFCNLRTEEYANDSRIPTSMDFGTPEEDAFRRDFTINSIFYNINQKKIEDLTNLGMIDLLSGVIRTPLQPMVTFSDDPLRILRGIRFACRFSFKYDSELLHAAQDPSVHAAFMSKITRERVGTEFQEIFEGNCVFGISSLISFNMFNETFAFDEGKICYDFNPYLENIKASVESFETNYSHFQHIQKMKSVLALIYSFVENPCELIQVPSSKKPLPKCFVYVMNAFKYSTDINQSVFIIVNALEQMREILDCMNELNEVNIVRIADWIVNCGDLWENALLVSVCKGILSLEDANKFVKNIHRLKLSEAYLIKPLVNGKMLIKDFGFKPGKHLGQILKQILNFQFVNRECSFEECVEFIRSLK